MTVRRRVHRTDRGGFTLLETVIALGIVTAVALGIAGGMRAAQLSSSDAEASRLAFQAARAEVERTKAMTVYDALQKAGSDATWTFEVDGLEGPVPGVAPGQVRLLSEEEAAVALGLAELDLDYDGVPNETGVEPQNAMLIFEVRVDWRSPGGTDSLRLVASTSDAPR